MCTSSVHLATTSTTTGYHWQFRLRVAVVRQADTGRVRHHHHHYSVLVVAAAITRPRHHADSYPARAASESVGGLGRRTRRARVISQPASIPRSGRRWPVAPLPCHIGTGRPTAEVHAWVLVRAEYYKILLVVSNTAASFQGAEYDCICMYNPTCTAWSPNLSRKWEPRLDDVSQSLILLTVSASAPSS